MSSVSAASKSAAAVSANADSHRAVELRRDVPALALVAATLLTLVAVVTYDPADPVFTPPQPLDRFFNPDNVAYPLNESVQNACGSLGAFLSAMLLDWIGVGTGLLIAAGGGIATALLHRGHLNAPVLRSLGGCVVLVGVTTAAAMTTIPFQGMPVVGNGGKLGAMTSTFLLEHFHPVGSWILTLAVLAVGLLLTTDYMLIGVGQKVVRGSASVSRRSFHQAARVMPMTLRRRREPFATDLPTAIKLDGERLSISETTPPIDPSPEPTIKFHVPIKQIENEKTAIVASLPAEPVIAPEIEQERPRSKRKTVIEEAPVEVWDETAEEEPVPTPHIRLPKQRAAKDELREALRDESVGDVSAYQLPSLELLEGSDGFDYEEQREEALQKSVLLQETIRSFGYNVVVTNVDVGPVIAQYEIELEAGLRLNKISALADDLAIALRVPSVRVVAPIPGKNTVGIEVPNEIRQVVRLRDVIEESDSRIKKMNIPVFLGKDVSGDPLPVDLAKMPHLLIAGRTGTGKSVCLNAIICSILMTCKPDEVRMLMIDPKMVELSGYGRLPHLMHPVITDMRKAEAILGWAVEKMEERYSLLAKVGVRHINSFNDLGRDEVLRRLEVDEDEGPCDVPDKLPFIVIVADEMADLMMTAGKEVEQHIIRLAQKSRAVGIHLILATQKPTVDVITGLIKSNLPARLSFQVASKTDSRVVLDENGADKLLGNGDMLFLWPGTSTLIRGQGTYLSDAEIDRICEQCSRVQQTFDGDLMNLKVDTGGGGGPGELNVENLRKKDELYESAIEVVIREGRGSLSLIQRCLGVGYGRAARLIDYMAEDGIVGQYNGSKSREVLLTMEQWQRMQGLDAENHSTEENDEVDAGPLPTLKPRAIASPSARPMAKSYDDDFDNDDNEYEDVDD